MPFSKFKNQFIKKFIQYGLVGLLAMGVDFSFVYFFTEFLHIFYLYSIVFAYLIASFINYLLQKKWTFNCDSKKYAHQYFSFLVVGLGGMLINLLVTYISVHTFMLWYIYGKGIATVLAFFWNFTVNQYLTFNKN